MLVRIILSLSLLTFHVHCQTFKGDEFFGRFFGAEVDHSAWVENFDYNYRLPGRVSPLHYKLEYVFDPDELPKVKGSVEVRAQVLEPEEEGQTLLMVIHSHPTIESFMFDMVDPAPPNKKFKQDRVIFDPHKQIATVPLPKDLNRDQVIKFNITFVITVRNFTHPDDEDTSGLVEFKPQPSDLPLFLTRMQMYRARRMFPCWDEPRFKATYELKLTLLKSLASDDLKVFSYTPVHQLEKSEGMKIYQFPESLKKMPTYVFTFTIGEFPQKICIEGPSCNEWTQTRPARSADYGKVCTYISKHWEGSERIVEVIKATKDTADLYYCPLRNITKFDTPFVMHYLLLRIPVDAGGCENWGSIYIDLTPGHPSQTNGLYLHEIAHYFYGNTVTPADWKDLWISEGIVSWMESYSHSIYGIPPSIAALKARWFFNIYFNSSNEEEDPRKSRRTVVDEHWAQGLNSEALMPLVYVKGSMVMFMLQSVLGQELFHTCLHDFLDEYQYNTPVDTQLMLDSFQESIGDFRDGWDKETAITEFMAPYIYFYNHTTIQVFPACQPFPGCQPTAYEIVRIDPPDTPEHFVWHTPVWIRDNMNLQYKPTMEWIEGPTHSKPKVGFSSSNITINPTTFGFYELEEDKPGWKLPPS